jgi:hypothetical protein
VWPFDQHECGHKSKKWSAGSTGHAVRFCSCYMQSGQVKGVLPFVWLHKPMLRYFIIRSCGHTYLSQTANLKLNPHKSAMLSDTNAPLIMLNDTNRCAIIALAYIYAALIRCYPTTSTRNKNDATFQAVASFLLRWRESVL